MEDNRQNLDHITPPTASSSSHPDTLPPPQIQQQDINQIDTKQKTIEGIGDAVKDSIKEEQKAKQTFDNLVNVSTRTLFQTKTGFPQLLFPSEVIIDLTKVTLVDHVFFGTKNVHSIFIADVTDVLVHNTLFSATLEIVDSGFTENSILVKHLPISDAQKARKIIQGLVIVKKQNIDLSKLDTAPDLVAKLETLGAYDHTDT